MKIRQLSAAEIADQQRDAVRLGPGVWRDRDGCLHWSIPELLAEFGLADTPAHRTAVLGILHAIADDARVDVVRQEPADDNDEEPDGFLG
jgi:hypothetical protein